MTPHLWIARRPCGCIAGALLTDRISSDMLRYIIGDWLVRGWAVDHGSGDVTVIAQCEHEQHGATT